MKKRAKVILNNLLIVSFLVLTAYSLVPTALHAQSGWGLDVRLTYDYAYNADPKAACCGDTIHLVWWKNYLDSLSIMHDEVFYKRSTDAGETWELEMRLSKEDNQSSTMPAIGVNGDFIHVVWTEQDIGVCYRKSSDGGISWLLIDTLPNAGLSVPWIHVDEPILYVIAGAGTGYQMLTKSTDNGNIWQSGQPVMHSCGGARLKKIDTLLLVLANPDNPYCGEIFCLKSYDDGQSWDSQCISYYDSVGSQHPAMDTDDSGNVHITWYDYKYSPYPWTGDVFYRASRDAGNSWQPIDSLTVQHRAVASDILAEGNNLHLVWEDDRNGFDDNFEIYYRMSSDLGQIWGLEVRLTDAPYKSICPSLACGGGYLHLFWSDLRDYGNNQPWMLYYKRKDLSWGIKEVKQLPISTQMKVEVHPNPFNREIRIRYWMLDTGDLINDLAIKIFDVSGTEVFYESMKAELGSMKMDVKDLPCGVYFVGVVVGDGCVVKKVVKVE